MKYKFYLLVVIFSVSVSCGEIESLIARHLMGAVVQAATTDTIDTKEEDTDIDTVKEKARGKGNNTRHSGSSNSGFSFYIDNNGNSSFSFGTPSHNNNNTPHHNQTSMSYIQRKYGVDGKIVPLVYGGRKVGEALVTGTRGTDLPKVEAVVLKYEGDIVLIIPISEMGYRVKDITVFAMENYNNSNSYRKEGS